MPNLHEMIGQRDVEIANLREEYGKLWGVLKNVKEGKTKIEDVTVFQDASGACAWKIVLDEPLPIEPLPIDLASAEQSDG